MITDTQEQLHQMVQGEIYKLRQKQLVLLDKKDGVDPSSSDADLQKAQIEAEIRDVQADINRLGATIEDETVNISAFLFIQLDRLEKLKAEFEVERQNVDSYDEYPLSTRAKIKQEIQQYEAQIDELYRQVCQDKKAALIHQYHDINQQILRCTLSYDIEQLATLEASRDQCLSDLQQVERALNMYEFGTTLERLEDELINTGDIKLDASPSAFVAQDKLNKKSDFAKKTLLPAFRLQQVPETATSYSAYYGQSAGLNRTLFPAVDDEASRVVDTDNTKRISDSSTTIVDSSTLDKSIRWRDLPVTLKM